MFVALYGVGYWFASTDPVRYWPFVLIGLLGKVLGPIGAVLAIFSGRLPPAFVWVNVTNDFGGACSTETPATLGACLAARAKCRMCLAANTADALSANCDTIDDGLANTSCP